MNFLILVKTVFPCFEQVTHVSSNLNSSASISKMFIFLNWNSVISNKCYRILFMFALRIELSRLDKHLLQLDLRLFTTLSEILTTNKFLICFFFALFLIKVVLPPPELKHFFSVRGTDSFDSQS